VVPVDERTEREERRVLGERHRDGELARPDRDAAAQLVEDEPEEGAVRSVHREPRGAPARAAGDGLAEYGDVGIVVLQQPLVERLDEAPDRGRRCARRGRA
jgi:hypothetical protein